jgi:hypothetical protein
MNNWIKTSDQAPNPQQNPDLIVAVPYQYGSVTRRKYSYLILKGGPQIDSEWLEVEDRQQWGASAWLRHDDGDVITTDQFEYWMNFDPTKIDWADFSNDPQEARYLLTKLDWEGSSQKNMIRTHLGAFVVMVSEEESTSANMDSFILKNEEMPITYDIIYNYLNDTCDYTAVSMADEVLELEVKKAWLLPKLPEYTQIQSNSFNI